MAMFFCKSGFCDRTDGFTAAELPEQFLPDQSMICKQCRVVRGEMALREAQRVLALRDERRKEDEARNAAAEKWWAEKREREIADVMQSRGEPNHVIERSARWTPGPQHLGGPYYHCPGCREIRHDPSDFNFIYRAGKSPLFDGDTLCDGCFANGYVTA